MEPTSKSTTNRSPRNSIVVGSVIGDYTVRSISWKQYSQKVRFYTCDCVCGKTKTASASTFRVVKHCTHKDFNLSEHPLYATWKNMIYRCTNHLSPEYKHYGGRGITVCKRWSDSLLDFATDMGDRPLGTTLDRIDNNKGYCKENCRWATKKQQMSNTRRNVIIETRTGPAKLMDIADLCSVGHSTLLSRVSSGYRHIDQLSQPPGKLNKKAKIITVNGQSKSIAEWSRETGVKSSTIHFRLKSGWDTSSAVLTPASTRRARADVVIVVFNGKLIPLRDLGERYNISFPVLRKRIFHDGMKPEEAVLLGVDKEQSRRAKFNKGVKRARKPN